MFELTEAFRALGDPTRLRILRLVGEAKLNVSEVVSVIGVAQSSVSHHLAKLKSLELIREERQASFTYYSLAIDSTDPRWPLISLARQADDRDAHGDQARLTDLLHRREDRQTLNEKLLEPGQSWRLWATALSSLLPPLDVVDFGCGSGVLTLELAQWAAHVTAIDHNHSALAQAAERDLPRHAETNSCGRWLKWSGSSPDHRACPTECGHRRASPAHDGWPPATCHRCRRWGRK